MKKYLFLIVFILCILNRVCSQSFTIHLNPDTLILNVGQTDTLSLYAIPSGVLTLLYF